MNGFEEVEIFFHIGLPKSASTFLQRNYFPWLDALYLGKHYHWNDRARRTAEVFEQNFKAIFASSPINIEPQMIGAIRQAIAALASEFNQGKMIYSNEGLVGSYAESFRNGYLIAHSLKKIFDRPKIILVIRRQDHFLESLYRQAIRNGRSMRVAKFLNYKEGAFHIFRQDYRANIDLRTLRWDQLANFYNDTFGRENVLILPFEMLKDNQERFLAKITKFIGVPPVALRDTQQANRRDTFLLLEIKKFFNSMIHPNISNIFTRALCLKPIGRLINQIDIDPDFISSSFAAEIRLFFKEGNRTLSTRENLSLDRYGYF